MQTLVKISVIPKEEGRFTVKKYNPECRACVEEEVEVVEVEVTEVIEVKVEAAGEDVEGVTEGEVKIIIIVQIWWQ